VHVLLSMCVTGFREDSLGDVKVGVAFCGSGTLNDTCRAKWNRVFVRNYGELEEWMYNFGVKILLDS